MMQQTERETNDALATYADDLAERVRRSELGGLPFGEEIGATLRLLAARLRRLPWFESEPAGRGGSSI